MLLRLSSKRSHCCRSILSRSSSVLSPQSENGNHSNHDRTIPAYNNCFTTASLSGPNSNVPKTNVVSPPSSSSSRYTATKRRGHVQWFSTESDVPSDDVDDVDDGDTTDHNNDGTESSSSSTPSEDEEDTPPTDLPSPPPPPPPSQSAPKNLLKPNEIVANLNRHIVGQNDAKRSVAIAMRNRWRRKMLPEDLRAEVTPRNVLMIGPTGCGKTEVARRMAALSDAPFIKVEATKFTEVGYHGRDVDQIIRDLMDISMNLAKKRKTEQFREAAASTVEDRILDLLTGTTTPTKTNDDDDDNNNNNNNKNTSIKKTRVNSSSRDSFRSLLRQGSLDEQEIEVDVPIGLGSDKGAGGPGQNPAGGIFTLGGDVNNPNLAAVSDFLSRMTASNGGGKGGGGKGGPPTERKKMSIAEARGVILDVELERMLETVDLKREAIESVEESGIVFIDEIDKICSSRDFSSKSADASAEGVQRDLLPLVEGTTISTKYGNVNTDYVLFIASGAFHSVKPSDMLPELQGRLPIRVELNGLTEEDLYKILTEPVANLLRQQVELIATEGVTLNFEDDAVREIARMAALLNRTVENIGARRLHTVIERIMEALSFEAAEMEEGATITVDKALVEERLSDVLVSSDLSRYIL